VRIDLHTSNHPQSQSQFTSGKDRQRANSEAMTLQDALRRLSINNKRDRNVDGLQPPPQRSTSHASASAAAANTNGNVNGSSYRERLPSSSNYSSMT
jgi:hypothetical protein